MTMTMIMVMMSRSYFATIKLQKEWEGSLVSPPTRPLQHLRWGWDDEVDDDDDDDNYNDDGDDNDN